MSTNKINTDVIYLFNFKEVGFIVKREKLENIRQINKHLLSYKKDTFLKVTPNNTSINEKYLQKLNELTLYDEEYFGLDSRKFISDLTNLVLSKSQSYNKMYLSLLKAKKVSFSNYITHLLQFYWFNSNIN